MSFTIPSDSHSVSDTGHTTDHNNMADVLTGLIGGHGEALTSGEALFPRTAFTQQQPLVASTLQVIYWTAVKTETVNTVKTITGGTAASGLTYAAIGLYTVDGSGNLTRAASTADLHTTLWTSTFTKYASSLTSGFSKVAGVRYALGLLAVGTTPPSLFGQFVSFSGEPPVLAVQVSGQSTLPASVAVGSIFPGEFEIAFQAVVTP